VPLSCSYIHLAYTTLGQQLSFNRSFATTYEEQKSFEICCNEIKPVYLPHVAYLWVGQFSTLQACHVTAQSELFTMQSLQVLLPLNNLIVDLLFCFRVWHYTLLQVCHVLQLVVLYGTFKVYILSYLPPPNWSSMEKSSVIKYPTYKKKCHLIISFTTVKSQILMKKSQALWRITSKKRLNTLVDDYNITVAVSTYYILHPVPNSMHVKVKIEGGTAIWRTYVFQIYYMHRLSILQTLHC